MGGGGGKEEDGGEGIGRKGSVKLVVTWENLGIVLDFVPSSHISRWRTRRSGDVVRQRCGVGPMIPRALLASLLVIKKSGRSCLVGPDYKR